MTNYQELENKIQELQKEVERLKQEEKAEQIDLSTCITGQLVQLRNGKFEYYEYRNTASRYVISGVGVSCNQDGSQFQRPQYDVVKVFPAEIPVPDSFDASYAKEVLKGRISCLITSFAFTETPQGDKYWYDICEGKTNLSFGDIIFIQKWIIQTL